MKSSLTLDKILDAVYATTNGIATITQRRKHMRREHIVTFVNIASTLVSAMALALPQLEVVANILNNLQKQTAVTVADPSPHYLTNLIIRLQAINAQMESATNDERIRLEIQRDTLVKLMCDYKQTSA